MCALGGIGIAGGQITRAAADDLIGQGQLIGFFKGLDHIKHAVTGAGAQIKDFAAPVIDCIGHGCHMALGQIHNMDIVSDAGAVMGVIVIAVDAQEFPAADGNLGDVRHQVVWDTTGIFTDAAGIVSTDGVEVAQQDDGPLRICSRHTGQDLLGHVLGPAVRVGAIAGAGSLAQGHLVVTGIDSSRRRENDPLAAHFLHDLGQYQSGIQVVVIVTPRLLHGFTNSLQTGKMNHCADFMLCKNLPQQSSVAHVPFIERYRRTGEFLYPFQALGVGVAQIVNDHNFIAALQQFHTGVRTDITGTAGNQNFHSKTS